MMGMNPALVFSVNRVAAVVVAVLDAPVAAVPLQQLGGVGLLRACRGDAVGEADGLDALLDEVAFPGHSEGLFRMGEGQQARRRTEGVDPARLDSSISGPWVA